MNGDGGGGEAGGGEYFQEWKEWKEKNIREERYLYIGSTEKKNKKKTDYHLNK